MNKVIVGKIVNTCGLKGEVKVINSSSFVNERYKKTSVLTVINDSKNICEKVTVSGFRTNNKFIYLKFKEINSIEEAERFKESELVIDGDNLERIDEDTFYHYELLNMKVYYGGNVLGIITEIYDNGAQDLIRVQSDEINVLVPFLDEFIESIDVENKTIHLKNLGGLV